ncbi:MAG: hypothetical protein AAFZ09_13365 [Pseudomonadota bacterium]
MTDEHTNPDPLVRPGLANRAGALATPIAGADIGHAVLTPDTPVEAGSWQTLTLSYTCGRYGIDDSGALRVCWRFAADHTKPQFHDPAGPGFTTVTASNNAVLDYRYDMKGNVRPWDRTLAIRVVDGFMQEGDTVTIVFGDRSQGGPGMRMQTFCTPWFEFRTLVDPIATYQFQPVPRQPGLAVLPAAPDRFVAHVPTLARPGRPFALKIKAEDVWGNPTDKVDTTLHLRASAPVEGLPATVDFRPAPSRRSSRGSASPHPATSTSRSTTPPAPNWPAPTRSASPTPPSTPSGRTCTASRPRRSAPTRPRSTSPSPATAPSSMPAATRATTSR